MATTSTGYGPSVRLLFDGDDTRYEIWETKFLGYMRRQKLIEVLTGTGTPDVDKNADAYGELVQVLDDRSLSLIIRDAKDDGRKALQILRDHYMGTGKPRIISLYTELTSLKMNTNETVTDYVIRAETAANSLKQASEVVSDSLLIAMVLKGLPSSFKTFSTVITQKDTAMDFMEFKIALRNFEETEKAHDTLDKPSDDNIMKVGFARKFEPRPSRGNFIPVCHTCGVSGHKSPDCTSNVSKREVNKGRPNTKYSKKWCINCKSKTHNTSECRKGNSTKSTSVSAEAKFSGDSHSFLFKANSCTDDDTSQTDSDNCNNVVFKMNNLLVDCGATSHIITDSSKFIEFDRNFNPSHHYIELADGSRTNGVAHGRGTAKVLLYDVNGSPQDVFLSNALYVPSYKHDLFSVQAATENGVSVNFSPNYAELKAPNGTVFPINSEGKLYFLDNVKSCDSVSYSLYDWHSIMGHCNYKDLLKLENVVEGMKISSKDKLDCEICAVGKMSQYRNREPDKRATSRLALVYCDLAGPIDPVAREGFKYAISFVDDYTGTIIVYFLKNKSDTVAATERFLADVSPYGNVKCIRTDNGTEFTAKCFKDLLVKNAIKHEFTAPYSPHQNGTVERSWRTIYDMARCILLHANLPKTLWTYAVKTSAYIRNRCFNPRTGKTPYEMFTDNKPNLRNMHIFGTVCYSYKQEKKKLDPRSERGIFLGYDGQSPAYLVYYPNRNDVKRVRCVKFTDKFPHENMEIVPECHHDVNEEPVSLEALSVPTVNTNDQNLTEENEGADNQVLETRRYPVRERNAPSYLEEYVTDLDASASDDSSSAMYSVDFCYRMVDVPRTYQDAITSPDSSKWHRAMQEEMNSLKENDTFELTSLPEGRSAVGGRWVFTVKSSPNSDDKFKARYVAKGYSQVRELDYHETFSPTARITSIRLLLQLAQQENLIIHQMDVSSAYLNAPIDTEIFIDQPEGFVKYDVNGKKLFFRLKKSIYGLKQSGRNWYELLHNFLLVEGFEMSLADSCVYCKKIDNLKIIIIFWVDDIIIAASNEQLLNVAKRSLSQNFKMKDFGKLSWFLGIEFKLDPENL